MNHFSRLFNITEVAAVLEGLPKNVRSSVWINNFSEDLYKHKYLSYF